MRINEAWLSVAFLAITLVVAPSLALGVSARETEIDTALRVAPNFAHGATIFETCAACHGSNAEGAVDGSVPAIAGQHFRVIIQELVNFRYDARIDIRMQHFVNSARIARAQDLADVAAYVASLQPVQPRVNGGAGAGQSLYVEHCAGCHGSRAEGEGKSGVPRLAGQHVEYLIRQLGDAVAGRRLAMSRDHAVMLRRLDSGETSALAEYLSGLDSALTPEQAQPAPASAKESRR